MPFSRRTTFPFHSFPRVSIGEMDPVYLVADGGDEADELGIAGELGDMLDQPLDHLGVSLPEGRHQAGHLPVVLTVDVRAWNR